jgi:hypothetical protein
MVILDALETLTVMTLIMTYLILIVNASMKWSQQIVQSREDHD